MRIQLAIQNPRLQAIVENRLDLYNLPDNNLPATADNTPENSPDPTNTILITDQNLTPQPNQRLIRLGVDLQLPGDETLFHQLLTNPPQGRYPLVFVASARGRSGATSLVTHPRLAPLRAAPALGKPVLSASLPSAPALSQSTQRVSLIRVNLVDDPSFSARLTIPHTRLLWDETLTSADFALERLPAGELTLDTDATHNPPWPVLPEILSRLAAAAPVVVDAGRVGLPLEQLAQRCQAEVVVACAGRFQWFPYSFLRSNFRHSNFPRAEIQTIAQKWGYPTVSRWQTVRAMLQKALVQRAMLQQTLPQRTLPQQEPQ